VWGYFSQNVYFMGFKKLYNTNGEHSYRPCADVVRTYRNLRMSVGCIREREGKTTTFNMRVSELEGLNILFGLNLPNPPLFLSSLKQPIYCIIGFSPRCKALYSPTPSGTPFIHPLPVFPSNVNNKKPFYLHTFNSNVKNANSLH
jgi:hypothetical protein